MSFRLKLSYFCSGSMPQSLVIRMETIRVINAPSMCTTVTHRRGLHEYEAATYP